MTSQKFSYPDFLAQDKGTSIDQENKQKGETKIQTRLEKSLY